MLALEITGSLKAGEWDGLGDVVRKFLDYFDSGSV